MIFDLKKNSCTNCQFNSNNIKSLSPFFRAYSIFNGKRWILSCTQLCSHLHRTTHVYNTVWPLFFLTHFSSLTPPHRRPLSSEQRKMRQYKFMNTKQIWIATLFDAIYVLASAYKPKQETFPFCLKLYRSTIEFAMRSSSPNSSYNGNQHFEQEKCLKNRKVNKVNIFFLFCYDLSFEWKWKQTFKQNTNDWNERW